MNVVEVKVAACALATAYNQSLFQPDARRA